MYGYRFEKEHTSSNREVHKYFLDENEIVLYDEEKERITDSECEFRLLNFLQLMCFILLAAIHF